MFKKYKIYLKMFLYKKNKMFDPINFHVIATPSGTYDTFEIS